jgi:hypothetical protein
MYLVTGHYDSRNSSNENTRDPAPGGPQNVVMPIATLDGHSSLVVTPAVKTR